jgi:hypothetical protein
MIGGPYKAQAVSHLLVSLQGRVSPKPVHMGFVVDKVAQGQVFLRVTSVFLCQYHPSNAPWWFIHQSLTL